MKLPFFSLVSTLLLSWAPLMLAQVAPGILNHPASQLVLVGDPASFNATATGTPAVTYQWLKGTAKIGGATNDDFVIPEAKTTDAGVYKVSATNGVGSPALSNAAYLAVVTRNQGLAVVKAGGTLTLKCLVTAPAAPGVKPLYVWQRGGQPLANGTVNGSVTTGADKTTLSITKVTDAHEGDYSCRVTFEVPGDDPPPVMNGDVNVQVVDLLPTVVSMAPLTVSVSQTLDLPLVASNFPTGFTATGLPRGLKLDPKTGRITGKPTEASKRNTANTAYLPNIITFKASNPVGTGPELKFSLTIEALHPSYIGTFNGVVARSGASNFGLGGHVQIVVNSSGTVSGSATLAGQKHSVVGVLDISIGNEPTADLLIKRTPATLGDLLMDININFGSDLMQGGIIEPGFELTQGELAMGDPEEPDLVNGSFQDARYNSPKGIAILPNGSGYISDNGNHVIRFVDDDAGMVTTFAGNGTPGAVDETGMAASFNGPEGLALDRLGNLYVADAGNSVIRRITPAGVVSTFAGTAGQIGSTNGTGSAARFSAPCALCFDPAGNLYVADRANHLIRKITPGGVVTTLAGKASVGAHKDGSGTNAVFHEPRGITYDPVLKALFVADKQNRVIRKVTLTGAVTTYAGSPGVDGFADGLLANTRFIDPVGIVSMGNGTLVVLDTLLVQLNPNGTACTVSDRVDTVNFLDHPVAAVFDPVEGNLIAVHDTLHAISSHEGGAPATDARFDAMRNPWTAAPAGQVPLVEQGLYNAVMETTAVGGDMAFPLGDGFLQVAVSKTGVATWAGKAADGSSITFGTFMAINRSIPLHASLYKNTGSLQGECFINNTSFDIVSDTVPAFDWYKIPQPLASTDRSYKSGFATHALEVTGGKFTPNDLHAFLELPAGPATMQLGFVESRINQFTQNFTLTKPNAVVVPPNPDKSVTMKIDPKTGIFSGSFKDGSPAITVPFAGILINYEAGNARRGYGHYLIPDTASSTSLIRSWRVSLQ
ncbi:MAG: immunoglobulin domain-containing protein [Verrucomicrobiota bacterium]